MSILIKICLGVALALLSFPAQAQLAPTIGTPLGFLSQASTNPTLVQSGVTILRSMVVVNQTATVYFLKLYNKATAPACGTDTPVWRIPLPASATLPNPIIFDSFAGAQFNLGLGFCLTGALADNDSSNAATGVAINFLVGRR